MNKPPSNHPGGVPPLHTRFKPGQSGNPKGRPPGAVNLSTWVQRGLREHVVVTKNGKPSRMIKAEVISNRLLDESMKGDLKSTQFIAQLDQEAMTGQTATSSAGEAFRLPSKANLKFLADRLLSLTKEEE